MLAWFPENRLIVMIVRPCSTPSVPSLHFQQKAGQKGMTNQSEREARTWPYDHQGRHESAEHPLCVAETGFQKLGRTSSRHKSDSSLWLRLLEIISICI